MKNKKKNLAGTSIFRSLDNFFEHLLYLSIGHKAHAPSIRHLEHTKENEVLKDTVAEPTNSLQRRAGDEEMLKNLNIPSKYDGIDTQRESRGRNK